MNSRLLRRVILAGVFFSAAVLQAATVSWDGGAGDGLWSSAANWSGDTLPAAEDVINITGATVDWDNDGTGGDNLPRACTINLIGATLNATATLRCAASTINVDSTSTITGSGFWDLDDASFTFEDGASAAMNNWEQKDLNRFSFKLSASGFTAITPVNLRLGSGSLPASIANATYIVDMQDYEGDVGVITLMDFSGGEALTDSQFQTATLDIQNDGNYTANLQWNATARSVELSITALRQLDLYLITPQ